MTRKLVATWVSGSGETYEEHTVTVLIDGDILNDLGLALAIGQIEQLRASLAKRKRAKVRA